MTAPRGSKLFHNRSLQSQSETSVMQVVCLLIGISGFLFGIFAISRQSSSCKIGALKSVSVVWEHGAGIISGNDASSVETGIRRHGEVSRHKIMAFVGIFTGFGSVGRRRSLRMTWLPSDPQELERLEESTGLAFRFIIGRTNDKRKMDELQEEIRQYDDFLQLDIEEQYNKLPRKTLAFFKAAHALYDSEFYVKADDDIYLRPDRLSLLLAKDRLHPQTYIGCMKKGPVFTDPNLKWYEPLSYLLGKEYFLHAYGPIYALSAGVVRNLAALRNDSFRMFNNEDVTIGSWMLAMNVHHEANRQLCAPECGPNAIAVWDIPKCSGLCNPETKMVELHKMDICSQSPTLPSDD